MALQYASRGYISINNQKMVDVKRISYKITRGSKAVATMTPDGFNTGFTQGQYDIDLSFEVAVQDQLSRFKPELIDWASTNAQMTIQFGNNSDQFTFTNLFFVDVDESAPGPGEEITASFSFKALKIIDNVATSTLATALVS